MINSNELAKAVKGTLLAEGSPFEIDNLLLDSRRIAHLETSLFIPLVTSRRNAHQYIEQVYRQGVRAFLVSDPVNTTLYPDTWFIKVKNTLEALQQLALWHRSKFNLPVIGITGSNGKTVVKEWLYQLLESNYNIVRNPKSYNSQIGVALSVWQINANHTLGVFEAGISQADEMMNLEKIIRPEIGIFTNIGEAHSEGFVNQRHKINEKLNLFKHCNTLVYNKDYYELQDCIVQFASQLKSNAEHELQLLHWSRKTEAVLQITEVKKGVDTTVLRAIYHSNHLELKLPFTDEASIENATHCWLLLLHLQIAHEEIQLRMSKLTPIAMRLELLKGINNCTLINDSYNSDVSSFTIALDMLTQQNQHEKRTVILSDILQSGRDNELYAEVSDLLKQKNISRFIGIGPTLSRSKKLFTSNTDLQTEFYKTTQDFLHSLDITSYANESILIKGARKFEFEKIAKRLQERIHQTVMEINLNALVHNLNVYKSALKPDVKVMAMVKAFSYGSGSFEVANKLQFEGVDYLAVAYTDEGIFLRKHKINLPIMVMNADDNSFDQMIEWNLEAEIYNHNTLNRMLEAAKFSGVINYPIHIKFDTGMHRLGFEEKELDELITVLKSNTELRVASVFSHLAGSDEQALDGFTKQQAQSFIRMSDKLEQQIGYGFIRHLANSSAIARYPELHFDMVRLGLGLYGVDSSGRFKGKLQQVSQLKTAISQIKHLNKEETVGYNRKGVLSRDTTTATVCIGYADGVSRRLGNGHGFMLIHDKLAPIIGNVCMDMCMLDITDIPEAKEGDVVIFFGDKLPVTQVASWAATIPYEILTGISQRVKRVYFEE